MQITHPLQTICLHPHNQALVQILDQRRLPFEVHYEVLHSAQDAATAIRDMKVRGAPLIGVTAAYGLYLASIGEPPTGVENYYQDQLAMLAATRPTAVDLFHALHQGWSIIQGQSSKLARQQAALRFATQMEDDSRKACRQIGLHGLALLQHIAAAKQGQTINILTHCNAGYLACIAYGTATAPIYMAHAMGIPIHVFIDETRPRNQGARLTAFELGQHGIPHTIIADNAGGHLMQHSQVDIVITGADRCTRRGDAANKIGTYLKALAAADNQVPFYVALPSSTIDWQISDGVREIRIEQRDPNEVRCIDGWDGTQIREVLLCPPDSPAINYAFDVTPARLITGIITERGVCTASEAGLRQLFPEAPSA
jgi:methylthioribose-1-phosphate isomerase